MTRRLSISLLMAALAATVLVVPASAAAQRDRIDSFYTFPSAPDGRGFSSMDTLLTIENDPGAVTSNYYWSADFTFNGSSGSTFNGAYMGLQSGATRADGSVGKVAIFSAWGADPAQARAGTENNTFCNAFSGEGIGAHCLAAFEWVAGRAYDLRVRLITGGQWGAWVIDRQSRVSTLIGTIILPSTEQWIKSLTVFSEQWAATTDCPTITVAARFEGVSANAGSVAPSGIDNGVSGDCGRANVSTTDTGVRHELDLPDVSPPGPRHIDLGPSAAASIGADSPPPSAKPVAVAATPLPQKPVAVAATPLPQNPAWPLVLIVGLLVVTLVTLVGALVRLQRRPH